MLSPQNRFQIRNLHTRMHILHKNISLSSTITRYRNIDTLTFDSKECTYKLLTLEYACLNR